MYEYYFYILFCFRNITLVLKNTNEYFANNADIHLDSANYLPINTSILYEGYVLGNYFSFQYSIEQFEYILVLPPIFTEKFIYIS